MSVLSCIRSRPWIWGTLLVIHLTGCTSWRTNSAGVETVVRDKHPQEIRVTLAEGRRVMVRSPRLEGDSLIGTTMHNGKAERVSIAVADVREAAVQRTDAGKTILLVAGIGLTAAVIAAAIVASQDDYFSGGSGGGGGGEWGYSCPTVYSWDGNEWRLDSGTFGGAVSRGLQRTDLDNLEYARAVDGRIRLQVRAELQETDYVDQVRVLAVDHEPGVMVVPDGRGSLHGVRQTVAPRSVRDWSGADALARVSSLDEWNWESKLTGWQETGGPVRDGLELVFPRDSSTHHARLVVDARNTPWSAYLLGRSIAAHGPELAAWHDSLDHDPAFARRTAMGIASEAFLSISVQSDTGWERQALLWEAGPELNKRQVALLDLGRVTGDSVRIRLDAPPAFWSIDRVALDPGPEPAFTILRLGPGTSEARPGAGVADSLATTDGRYVALEQGDLVDLTFLDAPAVPGRERSYLLESSGYYRIRVIPSPETERALLAGLGTEPGALSRAATAELARATERLRGEGR